MTLMNQHEADARNRYRGAMLGLAVSDALGTTIEFSSPGHYEPISDMAGGGPFDLAPGQSMDDKRKQDLRRGYPYFAL